MTFFLNRKYLLLIVFLIGTSVPNLRAQDCKQLPTLWDLIKTYHVQPKPLNDTLSVTLYNDLFEQLDPGGLFFIEKT